MEVEAWGETVVARQFGLLPSSRCSWPAMAAMFVDFTSRSFRFLQPDR